MQLGPGILGNIFDGIQRPLKAIAQRSGDVFIPRGVAVPALDETAAWEFAPTTFKVCIGTDQALAASMYWENRSMGSKFNQGVAQLVCHCVRSLAEPGVLMLANRGMSI